MSQYAGTPSDPYADPFAEPPKTSGLAVASLVCSLVVCCPCVTVLGPVLGLIALATMGAARGRGMAIAGILIGALVTALWLGGGWYTYSQAQGVAAHALRSGYDGNLTEFKRQFDAAAVPDNEAQAFIDELNSRYGRVVSSEIDWQEVQRMAQAQQGGRGPVTLRYRVAFEQGTQDVDLTVNDRGPSEFLTITVLDPAAGDLTFPPPDASPASTAPGVSTPTDTAPAAEDGTDSVPAPEPPAPAPPEEEPTEPGEEQ